MHTSYTWDLQPINPNKPGPGWCRVEGQSLSDLMITDEVEGNIHSLEAVETSSILQFLTPPYDFVQRDCHYYELAEENMEGLVWLTPCHPPTTFLTAKAPYTGCMFF